MKKSDDELPEGPSKSQRKRDMNALQALGGQLTEMTPAALKKCALPEELLEAVMEHNRLPPKHGARRRQLQYIGKVMRDMPEDVIDRISTQLSQDGASGDKRKYMALETLRTRLLAGNQDSIAQLLAEHPQADLDEINALINKARLEAERAQTPLASRKLFQLLRKLYGV